MFYLLPQLPYFPLGMLVLDQKIDEQDEKDLGENEHGNKSRPPVLVHPDMGRRGLLDGNIILPGIPAISALSEMAAPYGGELSQAVFDLFPVPGRRGHGTFHGQLLKLHLEIEKVLF